MATKPEPKSQPIANALRRLNDLPDDERNAEMATWLAAFQRAVGDKVEDFTPEDRRAELRAQLPGTYVDTWAMLSWYRHIRIVMGETFGTGEQYRTAFVMALDDAETFAKRLLRTIERRRTKDAEIDANEANQADNS